MLYLYVQEQMAHKRNLHMKNQLRHRPDDLEIRYSRDEKGEGVTTPPKSGRCILCKFRLAAFTESQTAWWRPAELSADNGSKDGCYGRPMERIRCIVQRGALRLKRASRTQRTSKKCSSNGFSESRFFCKSLKAGGAPIRS